MSGAALLALAMQFIMARAEKGFPLAKELFAKFRDRILDKANSLVEVTAVATFGAAPDELKNIVLDLLKKVLESSDSVWLSMTIRAAIFILPRVTDKLWDKLFETQLVPAASSTFPTVFSGPDEDNEDAMIAECELPLAA